MAGERFVATDLYAPVLKAHESRLLPAIAAAEGCSIYKTDTSQPFLYGSMENDVEYIRAPDWWPEPIPEGHCLQLLKSIYGTRQAARRWHKHISARMEANGYFAANSEKTIFMKREGKQFIIHGLFVDDMMHIATNNKLKNEFMEKFLRDFNITGGGLMKTFLGMEIEQATGRSSCTSITTSVRCSMSTRCTSRSRCDPSVFLSRQESSFVLWIALFSRIHQSRSFTGRFLQSFSLRLRGFASISRSQYRSWLDFVLRQAQRSQPTGQHFTT